MVTHLALDIGLSHTGVAISYEGELAEGISTINTNDPEKLFQKILELIKQYSPSAIVIGYPPYGPIQEFANVIKNKLEILKIPISLVDEDRTTLMAQKALIESNASTKDRQQRTHQAAAAAILQLHLDNLIE